MFPAGRGGAWSQKTMQARTAKSGTTASDLALRKKNERVQTTKLWKRLEELAPEIDDNKGKPGYRSKVLRGRTREELLKDVMHAVRLAQGLRIDDLVLRESK